MQRYQSGADYSANPKPRQEVNPSRHDPDHDPANIQFDDNPFGLAAHELEPEPVKSYLLDTIQITDDRDSASLEEVGNSLNGTDFESLKNETKKRFGEFQQRKHITQQLNEHLKREAAPYSPTEKAYRRAMTCSHSLMQDAVSETERAVTVRFVTQSCEQRTCINCLRRRAAKLWQQYAEPLREFKSPQLVTLTIPNAPETDLIGAIDGMQKTFNQIRNKINQDRSRGQSELKASGVRKLEITYNSERNDYHPHFHLVINSAEAGDQLISEWLKRYPAANHAAQDMRPVKDQGSLSELFKYFTKIHTKTGNEGYNIKAIHVMFQAIQKKRVVQPFGDVKAAKPEKRDSNEPSFKYLYYVDSSIAWHAFDNAGGGYWDGGTAWDWDPEARDYKRRGNRTEHLGGRVLPDIVTV